VAGQFERKLSWRDGIRGDADRAGRREAVHNGERVGDDEVDGRGRSNVGTADRDSGSVRTFDLGSACSEGPTAAVIVSEITAVEVPASARVVSLGVVTIEIAPVVAARRVGRIKVASLCCVVGVLRPWRRDGGRCFGNRR
jgi:hypothetical protein